jgi:hypothetical protein
LLHSMSAATLWGIVRYAVAIGAWLMVYQVFPRIALLALAAGSLWFLIRYRRFLVPFVIATFSLLKSYAATLWASCSRTPPIVRYAVAIGVWLIVYQVFPGIALLALAAGSLWFLRGYQRFLVLFVIGTFSLLQSCGLVSLATVRYHMAFEVEMNGKVKSGSSIIELKYSSAGDASGRPTIVRWRRGVAAVIDLGDHGTLVAALGPEEYAPSEWDRRKKQFGLSCSKPKNVKQLFDAAYGLDEHAEYDRWYLAKLRWLPSGKRKLTDDHLPAFIWFPRGAPYKQAQELCPEEFARVIGADIRLRAVSIELAPSAPVQLRLDIQAPWLEEMRSDKNHGSWSGPIERPFSPYLPAQIESCSNPDLSRCFEWR